MQKLIETTEFKNWLMQKYQPALSKVQGIEAMSSRELLLWLYDHYPEEARQAVSSWIDGNDPQEGERRRLKEEQMRRDNIILASVLKESVVDETSTLATFKDRVKHPSIAMAREATLLWAKGIGKPMLVLAGMPGLGKTHLAHGAVQFLREAEREVLYFTDADLVTGLHQALQRHEYEEAFDNLATVHWLIWDDLGLPSRSDWDKGVLDQIVNERWTRAANGLHTMITTNFKEEQMSARMASRLTDVERARVIELNGIDYRKARQ